MKRTALPRSPCTTRNGADAGFSLVELMMAMAVFGALMVIVSAATLQGFAGIREVMKRTNSVADAQLATEWLAKQIRYTARPGSATSLPIISASSTGLDFYTTSGSGVKNEMPYEVVISVISNLTASNTKSLVSDVYTLTGPEGAYTRYGSASRRVLLTVTSPSVPLSLSVHATCTVTVGCGPSKVSGRDATALLTLYDNEKFDYITIAVGNPSEPKNVITQQVGLVNL